MAIYFAGYYKDPKSTRLIKITSVISIIVMSINTLYYLVYTVYKYKKNEFIINDICDKAFGGSLPLTIIDFIFSKAFLPLNILISAAILFFTISLLAKHGLNSSLKKKYILIAITHACAVIVGIGTFVWEQRMIYVWNQMAMNFYIVDICFAVLLILVYLKNCKSTLWHTNHLMENVYFER